MCDECLFSLTEQISEAALAMWSDVVVIPVPMSGQWTPLLSSGESEADGASLTLPGCIGVPPSTALPIWRDFVTPEFETAQGQGLKDAMERGLVLSVKKNGKIARRTVGVPRWAPLADELASVK